jgi:hypothetical protein
MSIVHLIALVLFAISVGTALRNGTWPSDLSWAVWALCVIAILPGVLS